MDIRLATNDTEIAACFPVLKELRPHLAKNEFVCRIKHQQQSGYLLAFLGDPDCVVAVAGFRIGENLAWGRFLYVDDLVTLSTHRSKGYGSKLLTWLKNFAKQENCMQLHLDSGIQRKEAHRFYEREGLATAGLHFVEHIRPT